MKRFRGLDIAAASLAGALLLAGQAHPQTETVLVDDVPEASDQMGFSVAIDAGRALAGVAREDDPGPNDGKALVFLQTSGGWSLEETLTGIPSAGPAELGWSCDIDGDSAIVGAPSDTASGMVAGAAYIYRRSGSLWVQEAQLVADFQQAFGFGDSVAISGDRAAVGAPFEGYPSFVGPGFVYLYERDPLGNWVEVAQLTGGDSATGDEFGFDVALDGDVLFVGASHDDDQGSASGAAYVFLWDGLGWSEHVKLVPGDGAAQDNFGGAVDVDGDFAVIGAPMDDDKGADAGSAYLYQREPRGRGWVLQKKLLASDGSSGDQFGRSVALEGTTAVVGSWNSDVPYYSSILWLNAGAVYVFERTFSSFAGYFWFELVKLVASTPEASRGLGFSVGFDAASDCVVAGAVNADAAGMTDAGAAYLFCDLPRPTPPFAELDVICCLPILDPGGPFTFEDVFFNALPQTTVLTKWIDLRRPDGSLTRLVAPKPFALLPGERVSESHVLQLSSLDPPGTYVLELGWTDAAGNNSLVRESFKKQPGAARFR